MKKLYLIDGMSLVFRAYHAMFRSGLTRPDGQPSGAVFGFTNIITSLLEKYEPDHLLRLAAEMKVPGRAWLEFEVTREGDGLCTVRQTASFDPVGLFGLAYWYAMYPLHQFVFAGMLNNICLAAKADQTQEETVPPRPESMAQTNPVQKIEV